MDAHNARSVATQILTQVIGKRRSLSDCLVLSHLKDSRERSLAQALCYGVLRWQPRLEAILKILLRKPFKEKDYDIHALLLIGLYQHLYLRTPPHAATAATVEVTRTLKKAWATGLVNGVLRNFQRQREELLAKVDKNINAKLAHPAWIIKALQKDWPSDWQNIAEANNSHPPMSLRVNSREISRNDYLKALESLESKASALAYADNGISLEQPIDVLRLPGFNKGWVSVQDGAAQIAAQILDVPAGARVLDACAAPGGKMAHLLELYDVGTLLALDNQISRVEMLKETLERLKLLNLSAQVRCADASQPDRWWDGETFDRILLDAPCTGSGVIRRHPDIKYLRQAKDIVRLAAQQAALLTALWPLLAPGGKLLYVTCSVFAEENHLQIQKFIKTHTDAIETVLEADWGHAQQYGRQILPGENNLDGFYYACLSKTI